MTVEAFSTVIFSCIPQVGSLKYHDGDIKRSLLPWGIDAWGKNLFPVTVLDASVVVALSSCWGTKGRKSHLFINPSTKYHHNWLTRLQRAYKWRPYLIPKQSIQERDLHNFSKRYNFISLKPWRDGVYFTLYLLWNRVDFSPIISGYIFYQA